MGGESERGEQKASLRKGRVFEKEPEKQGLKKLKCNFKI